MKIIEPNLLKQTVDVQVVIEKLKKNLKKQPIKQFSLQGMTLKRTLQNLSFL